jgi:hypothetical protein
VLNLIYQQFLRITIGQISFDKTRTALKTMGPKLFYCCFYIGSRTIEHTNIFLATMGCKHTQTQQFDLIRLLLFSFPSDFTFAVSAVFHVLFIDTMNLIK